MHTPPLCLRTCPGSSGISRHQSICTGLGKWSLRAARPKSKFRDRGGPDLLTESRAAASVRSGRICVGSRGVAATKGNVRPIGGEVMVGPWANTRLGIMKPSRFKDADSVAV